MSRFRSVREPRKSPSRKITSVVRLLIALVCLTVFITGSPALAGIHSGGSLIVHTNEDLMFSHLTLPCLEEYHPGGPWMPAECEQMTTQATVYDRPIVIWFLTAFHESVTPAVTGIVCGLHHDLPGPEWIETYGACGPAASHGTPDFPGSGSGFVVVYDMANPIRDNLFPFYFFAIWGDEPGDSFGLGIHPDYGTAWVFDDSAPFEIDLIHRFGAVRWDAQGFNECPVPPAGGPPGACCIADECYYVPEDDCFPIGAEFLGEGVPCDPNPCLPSACCMYDGSCEVLNATDCFIQGGVHVGGPCDPNPCGDGACCMAGGICETLNVFDCYQFSGFYVGGPCDPNPCEALAVPEGVPGDSMNALMVSPNPFSHVVRFAYRGARSGNCRISVFDLSGRLVHSIDLNSPSDEVFWDGTDRSGDRLAPGAYFIRLDSPEGYQTKQLFLIR
jgi:hypothetical protein